MCVTRYSIWLLHHRLLRDIVLWYGKVAKAIDMIVFHIESDIYPRRIIFTACAPNHDNTLEEREGGIEVEEAKNTHTS